jgi:hypothetical protein
LQYFLRIFGETPTDQSRKNLDYWSHQPMAMSCLFAENGQTVAAPPEVSVMKATSSTMNSLVTGILSRVMHPFRLRQNNDSFQQMMKPVTQTSGELQSSCLLLMFTSIEPLVYPQS